MLYRDLGVRDSRQLQVGDLIPQGRVISGSRLSAKASRDWQRKRDLPTNPHFLFTIGRSGRTAQASEIEIGDVFIQRPIPGTKIRTIPAKDAR